MGECPACEPGQRQSPARGVGRPIEKYFGRQSVDRPARPSAPALQKDPPYVGLHGVGTLYKLLKWKL